MSGRRGARGRQALNLVQEAQHDPAEGHRSHQRDQVLQRLGDDVVVVPNSAGITGGVRAWDLRE
ncbi:hypothetical protein [Bogoriella caseilytica]|uniref:hypothetical protein n=1 Tax=Bogoriella caseilytica TaxID=56055 RepID=UPI003CCC792F